MKLEYRDSEKLESPMNAQDWVSKNCKFASVLSPEDQARSQVVGTSYAVVNQYKKYKATSDNADLMMLFHALDMLSETVANAKTHTAPKPVPAPEPVNAKPVDQK